MKKHGLAKLGQVIGNLCAGTFSDYEYPREKPVAWQLSPGAKWIFKNVNIVDVDEGRLFQEQAILIDGTSFSRRLNSGEVEKLAEI